MEKAPDDPAPYHVWQALEGNPQGVPQGKYLVDDHGQIKYLVDPAINGIVNRRDDGTAVQKFNAPKTRAHGPDHRGHPHPEAALDAGAPGRGHRAGAGT